MSSEKTTNLSLHKWRATDTVQRTEFNDNFGIIDTNIGTLDAELAGLQSDYETTKTDLTSQLAQETTQRQIDIDTLDNKKANKTEVNSLATGKADRGYVDELFTSLGSAKPSGAFPTLTDLQTAYPNGDGKNYYVVTSDNNWYYWNSLSWVVGGLFNATVSDDFPATNIVPNSSFDNGTTGWTATTTFTANSGIASFLSTQKNERLVSANLSKISGHKYYVFARFQTTSKDVGIHSNSGLLAGTLHSGSGEYERKSGIVNSTSTQSNYVVGIIDTRSSNWDNINVDYVGVINLTETFGYGNEPTLSEMDVIMSKYPNSWFGGTISPLFTQKELYLEEKVIDSRLTNIEGQVDNIADFPVSNIVSNSSFDNGSSGWSATTTFSISNGIATMIATKKDERISAINLNKITGHKYYVFARFKATSNQVGIHSNTGLIAGTLHSGNGQFERKSGIVNSTSTQTDYQVGIIDIRSSGWNSIEVDYVGVIDLTETFGSGKEPTALEMDDILSKYPNGWFDGTVKSIFSLKSLYSESESIKERLTIIESGDVFPYKFSPEEIVGDYTPISVKAFNGTEAGGLDNSTVMAQDIYDEYDYLLSLYPNYISKSLIGFDSTGTLPIYSYTFEPETPDDQIESIYKPLPKVIIGSGIHGDGALGDPNTTVIAVYYFFKDICLNWKESSILEYLRWNVRFVVIPVQNPWGFNNRTRQNSNGVDLNRNFDNNWTTTTSGEWNYGGSVAFSESEAQAVRDLVLENSDALFLVDHHTTGGNPTDDKLMVFDMAKDNELYYTAKQHIGKISRRWYGRGLSNRTFYGYVFDLASPEPKLYDWAYHKVGIPSTIIEGFQNSGSVSTFSPNDKNIITMNTEHVGNWVVNALKYFRDKK